MLIIPKSGHYTFESLDMCCLAMQNFQDIFMLAVNGHANIPSSRMHEISRIPDIGWKCE